MAIDAQKPSSVSLESVDAHEAVTLVRSAFTLLLNTERKKLKRRAEEIGKLGQEIFDKNMEMEEMREELEELL